MSASSGQRRSRGTGAQGTKVQVIGIGVHTRVEEAEAPGNSVEEDAGKVASEGLTNVEP